MAEAHSPFDEANDYLLGWLTPAARRNFETRLATDVELRRRVRDLQEGVLALALAAPPRAVPCDAWSNIEAAVVRPAQINFIFPFLRLNWLTSGLALAVCLAVGFFVHALWFAPEIFLVAQHSDAVITNLILPPPGAETIPLVASQESNVPESVVLETNKPVVVARAAGAPSPTPSASQNVSRGQQPLAPAKNAGRGQPRLSAPMLRAVLLAVARQMGGAAGNPPSSETSQPVDFVDLPGGGSGSTIALNEAAGNPLAPPLDFSALPPDVGNEIPMFAMGNDLVSTIDPATLPAAAGPVSVWAMAPDGLQSMIGTVGLGGNPTVITINNANTSAGFQYFIIIGGTNLLGRFPVPQ